MANMKTDDSGVITTEFYTGRCPVRCELCFTNFGENGSSVPFTIYANGQGSVFDYATCQATRERLRKDRPRGELDWVQPYLCGSEGRNWRPVAGFHGDMTKQEFRRTLKPLDDDPGLYSIPKVPEQPWFRRIESVKAFNGQRLPAVLRCNSMSDSSVAPLEWVERIRDLWQEDCFFNSSVHAIKRHSAGMGLYHKLVVTANPGLQAVTAGIERYLEHYPTKHDIVADPGIAEFAREVYPELRNAPKGQIEEMLLKRTKEELKGLIVLRLNAGSMKGEHDRRWHFYDPIRIGELGYDESVIKFYRVRALPTIQPDVSKFSDVPVVYTVLRFKSVQQVCEFARKYRLDMEAVVNSVKDKVVCDFYLVPCRLTEEGEETRVWLRSDRPENASPLRGEWTELFWEGNYYRAHKDDMDGLRFVCDRAGKSCKACGLCATLDGTEPDWRNPKLAELGLVWREYAEQSSYVCDSNGMPVKTRGLDSKKKAVLWAPEELQLYKQTLRETGRGFRTQKALDTFRKEQERQKLRAKEARELRENPDMDVAEPFDSLLALMTLDEPRRNPDVLDDVQLEAMGAALRAVVSVGVDPDWTQSWDLHEDMATAIAQAFFNLLVLAKQDGLTLEEAVEAASDFSFDACGMDLFVDKLDELEGLWDGTSPWSDQFGRI